MNLKPGFKRNVDADNDTVHQIVARVSEDIRQVLQSAGDKIFIGFSAHRVFDRFYVKACAKCHRFGHYHADCQSAPSCGFCGEGSHESKNCPVHQSKEQSKYKCVNCEDKGKPHEGHSSHWHKCPSYIDEQKKMKINIPYYAKN